MVGDDSRINPPLDEPASPDVNAPEGSQLSSPSSPEGLNHAERSRTLLVLAKTATLSTLARDPQGFPYGSLVSLAVEASGSPLLLLSHLAEHTKNIEADPRVSLLVAEPHKGSVDPLSRARLTLLGTCQRIDEKGREEAKSIYLAAHPNAAHYADFADFAFYHIVPSSARIVEGFGRMSWVSAEDYLGAEPDPIAPNAEGILLHMNEDHEEALTVYARGIAGITDTKSATMTAVDRYGFNLLVVTPAGVRKSRIRFPTPVSTTHDVRKVMVELVKIARARLPSQQ